MLLEDLAKEYIYEIQIRNYTPSTIKGYKNNILRFCQFIKNEFEIVELEEVSPIHIKQYFDTGIRNFELCELKNLDVRETVIHIMGNGRKERVIPLSPYLKK